MKKHSNGSSGHEGDKVRGNKSLFYIVTLSWLAVAILVPFIIDNNSSTIVSLRYVFIAAMILWAGLSVEKIDEDMIAGIYLWGIPVMNSGPGPKFLLRGVFQEVAYPASVQQNQFPAEPELIQKTPDDVPLKMVKYTLPDGTEEWRLAVRPLRITTKGPDGTGDILDAQMAQEFTFWVRWVIENPLDFTIAAQGSRTKERIAEAVRQMRDSGESALVEEVTKRTPATLISEFERVHEALRSRIRKDVVGWGIRIIDVGLTSPDLSHDVAKSLTAIPAAKATAIVTRTNADAESYKLEKEGEGRGKAKAAELKGEGQGYKDAAELMGVEPRDMLAAQVARDTIGEGDVILGTEGITQAIGLGKFILDKTQENGKSRSST